MIKGMSTCLHNAQSNPELSVVYVDRSYASNPHIAAGYFQVHLRW